MDDLDTKTASNGATLYRRRNNPRGMWWLTPARARTARQIPAPTRAAPEVAPPADTFDRFDERFNEED